MADRAAARFSAWAAMGPNARRGILNKAAEELEKRSGPLVQAMKDEISATEGWALFNLMPATGMTREAAALTTRVGGEVIPSDKPGCLSMSVREPVGVVLSIAPWNAPIILGVRAIATPLACGNAVILKASELCPRTGLSLRVTSHSRRRRHSSACPRSTGESCPAAAQRRSPGSCCPSAGRCTTP